LDAKQKELLEISAYRWVSACEVEISKWSDCKDFALHKCTLDWSKTRRSSRGGWYATGPGINIAMAVSAKQRGELYRMYEYPSFDTDPVIGGFYATDPNLALGMVICHEMAHAVQFFRIIHLGYARGKPHGTEFKQPYAQLRKAILNPLLVNQKQLKTEYELMIKSITNPTASNKELDYLFGVVS
jgi:hypothetical protein